MMNTLTYKKYLLLFFLFTIQIGMHAELKILEKKINKTDVAIYAINTDAFPYTVQLNIKASNVTFDRKWSPNFLVSSSTTYQEIVVIKGKKGNYTYKYDYTYFEGNHLNVVHDSKFEYAVPVGENYKIMQGYNGQFSHAGKKAIDFQVPLGSKVYAARDGVIMDIKEDSDKGCINPNCVHFANYILVYHDDGTIGAYFHLQKNGVLVNKNQKVKKGEVIGLSGNTGWSTKPHLHFEVYIDHEGNHESVVTKFITKSGVKYLSK